MFRIGTRRFGRVFEASVMKYAVAFPAFTLFLACESGGGETRAVAEKIGRGVVEMKWDDVTAHVPDQTLVKKLIQLQSQLESSSDGNARHIEFVEFSESTSGANTIVKIHHRLRMDTHMAFQNADGVTGRVKYEMTMAKQGGRWVVSAMTWQFEKEPK